uniref:Uncharacterized protein n=1 Tax=Arundo donax TaxID=35708 RepID=A0A0A9EK01_ARUDO
MCSAHQQNCPNWFCFCVPEQYHLFDVTWIVNDSDLNLFLYF